MKIIIGIVASVFAMSFFANFVNAENVKPSFNCQMATSVIEKEICKNPMLAKKDAQLNSLFLVSKKGVFPNLYSAQIIEQKTWLKFRNSCSNAAVRSGNEDIAQCIGERYDGRILELAIANLIRDYDNSMPIIEFLNKENTQFYKAISIYVNTPYSKQRNDEITNLLKPYYKDVDANWPYPRAILDDLGVRSEGDIASTQKNLIASFSILSVVTDGVTMPCDAIRKKPELIETLAAVFGSSMDGQLIKSDCRLQLPHLPAFSTLSAAINRATPECLGTIRFAMWRDNEKFATEIGLGMLSNIESHNPKGKYSSLSTNFLHSHQKYLLSARNELQAHYKAIGLGNVSSSRINLILKNFVDDAMFEC